MKEVKSYRALLAGLALTACVGTSAHATLVADLAADFQPTALGQSTAAFNGGTGLSDTAGTGRWNYLQTNTGGGSPTFLTFQSSPGNSGLPAYAGVNQPGEGFAMPAISQNRIFGDGVTPIAGTLNVHPGNVEPLELVARWTVGQAGLYNLAGSVTDMAPVGNGINYTVRVNGVNQFGGGGGVITVGSKDDGFNLLRNLNVGDTVDLVVGPNGAGNWAADETRVKMQANSINGPIFANAGADYKTAANGTSSASANITDTKGAGLWTYFASDNVNINATPNEQLLTFGPIGNGGNSGYGGGQNGFNLPGVSNAILFGDGEPTMTGQELSWHPGDVANLGPTGPREFTVLRWTAGTGESGAVDLIGNIRSPLATSDGTDFHILVDGIEVFTKNLTGADRTMTFFSISAIITPGSTVDFVLGNGPGSSNLFADESILSAIIVAQVVPEPTTLSCLAIASLALLRRRRVA